MKYLVCGCIITLLIATSCGKDCFDAMYSFNTNAKAYPDKDSIAIGDTIWLEVNIPTSLPDITSGKMVDYSSAANLGIAIHLSSLHGGSASETGAEYVLDSFGYRLINGTLSVSEKQDNTYLYDEVSNTYKFKLGIISMRKGTYVLSISDAAGVYRKSNKCTKASYIQTFSETNQHLYVYQNSRPGYQISDYESTHLYCFKVY